MKSKRQLRTHVAGKRIHDGHVLREIQNCSLRIAEGWDILKSGAYPKGSAVFSLIGTGLLTQIGWIVQGLEILTVRDPVKWRPLVDAIAQRLNWNTMRHDAAHYVDRIFTIDSRGNDPDSGGPLWHLIDPHFATDSIRTGATTIRVPELLSDVDDFLRQARRLVQNRTLVEATLDLP